MRKTVSSIKYIVSSEEKKGKEKKCKKKIVDIAWGTARGGDTKDIR